MYRIGIAVAAVIVILGLVTLWPKQEIGPTTVNAATLNMSGEVPKQFAVMIELVPTLYAIGRVQSMNLVNGLFLSDQQLKQIIGPLEERQRLEYELGELLPMFDQYEAELSSARDLLEQVEAVIVTGAQPSSGLAAETNAVVGDLHVVFEDVGRLSDAIDRNKVDTAEVIYGVLTENQKILVQEYVECIIPPVGDPNNPERIGQVSDEHIDGMRDLRQMDDSQYKHARENIIEELFGTLIKQFPDQQQGAAYEKQRIGEGLDYIRSLEGTQFEVEAPQLISLLLPYEKQRQPQPTSGYVDEQMVRERIFKHFVENNYVDMLKTYRDSR